MKPEQPPLTQTQVGLESPAYVDSRDVTLLSVPYAGANVAQTLYVCAGTCEVSRSQALSSGGSGRGTDKSVCATLASQFAEVSACWIAGALAWSVRIQHVIIQRRLPTYDFLVTASVSPELAAALLERSLSETGNFVRRSAEATSKADRPVAVRLAPRHFWSPQPCVTVRINPSVAGSNVHVSLSTQPMWWVVLLSLFALFLLTVSWAYTLREIPLGMLIVFLGMLIVFAVLLAAIGTVIWAIVQEASIAVEAVKAADIHTI